jgi:hypothetical protein
MYIVWIEELKRKCDFTETEYKQVLGSVKSGWLSMLPAVITVKGY